MTLLCWTLQASHYFDFYHLEGTLEADTFTYTPGSGNETVVISGNDGHLGEAGIAAPAILAQDYDNVIAVGASWGDSDYYGYDTIPGTRIEYDWWGSQYGAGLTLMGPSEVLTTSASNDYDFDYESQFNGTSAATPNVSGVASLVWSVNGDLDAGQIKDILSDTAYDLGDEGYDLEYGYGFVNADAAVRRAIALSYTDSSTSGSLSAVDSFTGGSYDYQVTDDSAFFAQQVVDSNTLEAIDDAALSFGTSDRHEMINGSLDYFVEDMVYNSTLDNMGNEANIFYNEIDV